ncbi:hypothetical protein [Roseovarius sp. MBR-6]|jgi:hypothetical protein|uniref:hypothetical protein n=1 Tax=Roseovarius sp. MBR-6 TaxID=3156459 RepID=UPI003394728D
MGPDRARGETPSKHFFLDAEEFAAKPPADAATTEIAVRNAVTTIGKIMREERTMRRRDGLPVLEDQLVLEAVAPPRRKPGLPNPGLLIARVRGWRPRPVHAGWALLFLAVVIWPRAVLIAMLAVFVLCLFGVALFGQPRLQAIRHDLSARLREIRAKVSPEADDDAFDHMPDPFDRIGDAGRNRLGS